MPLAGVETAEKLLRRYQTVNREVALAIAAKDRCKPGAIRDRKSRWVGCLEFTRLQIEAKMHERGLLCR